MNANYLMMFCSSIIEKLSRKSYYYWILYCFLIIILNINNVFSNNFEEDDTTADDLFFSNIGICYGFNFGLYSANRRTAFFYNGEASNINSLNKAIFIKYEGSNFIDYGLNNQRYKEIKEQALEGDDFLIKEYPLMIKYNPTLNYGFYGKYNFTEKSGIYANFNVSKFKVVDVFTIELQKGPSGHIDPDNILECFLNAKEARYDIDIGFHHAFTKKKFVSPFIELGFNFNNTIIESMEANINDYIFSYMDPSFSTPFKINQGGLGYGFNFSPGAQFLFTEEIMFQASLNLSIRRINIGEKENKGFFLNEVFILRLLYRGFGSYDDVGR